LNAFEAGGAENFALRPQEPIPAAGSNPRSNVFSLDAVRTGIAGTKDVVKEALGVFKEHGILHRREYAGVAPQVHGAPRDYEVGLRTSRLRPMGDWIAIGKLRIQPPDAIHVLLYSKIEDTSG
jgi:hypothetical protein